MSINVRTVRLDAQFFSCMHDTIQTVLTSEQKENVISLMSYFVSTSSSSSSSSNLYFARVIPSIQTVLLSIGALEFKNLQYTFKNLLQPIYNFGGP